MSDPLIQQSVRQGAQAARSAAVDLSAYQQWCLKIATVVAPDRPNDWHDIAQEGLIAMWKSLEKFDPERGALASWMTRAAKMRMKDVVRKETWTGTPMCKGHHREKPATPVDHREYGGLVFDQRGVVIERGSK